MVLLVVEGLSWMEMVLDTNVGVGVADIDGVLRGHPVWCCLLTPSQKTMRLQLL